MINGKQIYTKMGRGKIRYSRLTLSNENVLCFLLYAIPIVQIINSLFLFSTGSSNFGKIYRAIELVFLVWIMTKSATAKQTMWLCVLLFFSWISQIMNLGENLSVGDAVLNTARLISPYFFIACIEGLARKNKIGVDFYDKVFDYYCFFMPLSMIIPRVLGIGYSRYEGTGYQGLYYENNATTLVLIMVTIISIEQLIDKRTIKRLIIAILATISLAMTGSKSSIGFIVLIAVVYLIRFIFKGNVKKIFNRLIIAIISIILILISLRTVFKSVLANRLDVYHYYYTGGVLVNHGTILGFLTNGRSDFAATYFKRYYSNIDIHTILFGCFNHEVPRIEMDFFDILFYFGLPVMLLVVGFFIYVVFNSRGASFMMKFLMFAAFVYSFLAGHVWNSDLAGVAMILPYSFMLSKRYFIRNHNVSSKYRMLKRKFN